MAEKPNTDEGKLSWETEAKELRQLLSELKAAIPQVKAADLSELREAITATQAEIKTLCESAPNQSQAEALIKNLEKSIAELSDKIKTLEANPPQPKKPDAGQGAPQDPEPAPKKKQRIWV